MNFLDNSILLFFACVCICFGVRLCFVAHEYDQFKRNHQNPAGCCEYRYMKALDWSGRWDGLEVWASSDGINWYKQTPGEPTVEEAK